MRVALPTRQHFGELDALRGLAALVVVAHHFVLLGSPTSYSKFLLHVMANGHSAVMLFFVLSGFVLALPIAEGRVQPYLSYVSRRVCRIYLPYLAGLALALMCDALFHERQISSSFVGNAWSVPVSFRVIAQHVAFIGDYDYTQVNPAFWSLVHEMRISLIFPPFCLALYRLKLGPALVMLGCLTGLGTLLCLQIPSQARTFVSIHYMAIFGLGALLARDRARVASWYEAAGKPLKYVVALAAGCLYVSRTQNMALRIGPLADIPVALGAMLLIVLTLNSKTAKALLEHRLPTFLGRISYSLYLIHVTVLFVVIHFFGGNRPLVLFLYLTAALATAQVLWKFVEQPSIQLGKRLSQKVGKALVGREAAPATSLTIPADSEKNSNPEIAHKEPRQELLTT